MPLRFGFARPLTLIAVIAILASMLAGCLGQAESGTPAPTDIAVAIATPTAVATLELTPVPSATDVPPTPAVPTPLPTTWPADGSPWMPDGSALPPSVWLIPLPTEPPSTPPTGPPPSTTPAPPPFDISALVATVTGNSKPTRVAVPALHIDLPVIKSNPLYPKCNVAQYLTNFVNPGQPGSTYIYGHARTGMFLPLLNQSKINDGAGMIGMLVLLWTADTKLHLYRINIVKRHATDFTLATNLKPGQHRLILQTSEGPHGTIPKLQVAAKPIGVYKSTAAQALPTPHPVTCG
jgi:hypothetical protein